MDVNTLAIVITIIVAAVTVMVTVVIALYVSLQQGNKHEAAVNELRGEMQSSLSDLRGEMQSSLGDLRGEMQSSLGELRGDVRALGVRVDALGERFEGVESRQSRLEGVNETLAEILLRQSHTHESAD